MEKEIIERALKVVEYGLTHSVDTTYTLEYLKSILLSEVFEIQYEDLESLLDY